MNNINECEYCNNNGKPIMLLNGKRILWIENGYLYVNRRGATSYFIKVNNCPMCGRELNRSDK